ncbi:hypothetical protein ATSB10_13950 [Dyella thiooxydans]|uniref:Uncharacterized protein n=1 Tax=Dyella thiooxydans TaxID=445710 RepID=A0A169GRN6_9GAMM|nr:hypothetical protein ATSB10_13950 [Dyella thiooxydans]
MPPRRRAGRGGDDEFRFAAEFFEVFGCGLVIRHGAPAPVCLDGQDGYGVRSQFGKSHIDNVVISGVPRAGNTSDMR